MYSAQKVDYEKELKLKLPQPQGYRLLIAIPKVEEKTGAGVYMPDSLTKMEQTASIVGLVVEMGPDAYLDKSKFPNGPYCKKGDFVIFRSYSGTRFKVKNEEFRLINDDTVEAVVDDPRGFIRV